MFDGRAEKDVDDYRANLAKHLAEIGQNWIQTIAQDMDKSGRGGTGRAAEGVQLRTSNLDTYYIWGEMTQGEVWWPWLEGVSKRNMSTRYKGYRTFRRTRGRLNKYALPYAQEQLAKYIEEMNR